MNYKPHNYQAYCIQRIVNDEAIGLFLRPGLGKTSITLSAINLLKYYRWSISKALVVAPKKVAEATWSKESAKWDHTKHLRVSTILGTEKQRIKALNTPADIYVINRENIPWLVDYYKQAWPFDMVVLDESTSFKNSRSKRFKALKLVRRFIKKIVLLTGTPSAKDIMDLWAQVYLLDEGERLGRTITQFREMYFDCNTHGGHFTDYTAKDGAEEAVLNAIKDICISMKAEDYLELPDLITHDIPVELDIDSVVINGEEWQGYLDVGLRDTMKDLFVNFIGATVFSVIGYFYIKNRVLSAKHSVIIYSGITSSTAIAVANAALYISSSP